MKKHCSSALFVLLVVLFSLSNICVASAAMKNLLLEFYKATDIFLYDDYFNNDRLRYERDENSYYSYMNEDSYINRNSYAKHMRGFNKDVKYKERLNRIDELIKQGLNVNDTLTRMFCLALDVSSINAKKTNEEELNKAEAFCITLIKKLAKSKANFKNVFSDKFLGKKEDRERPANCLTNNLLRAFLDAGAEPQYYLLDFIFKDFRYKQGDKWDNQKAKLFLERAKILVEHKVKVDLGWFADSPMKIFLKNIYLFPSENFTEEDKKNHFEYISEMIELLHKAGADTKEAKEYLSELRNEYRNTPEALKYLDKIEKLVNKSSFCSLSNAGLLVYGILFLHFLICKKKVNK